MTYIRLLSTSRKGDTMRKSAFLFALYLTIVSHIAAQGTFDLKQMRDYFGSKKFPNGPYIYLQSPRTGMGVGTIYSIVNGQNVFYSRPEECFSQDFLARANNPSEADTMAVPNLNIT